MTAPPLSELPSLGRPSFGRPFSAQRLRPDDFHRERRIASIIITALAAAKMPTNKK
jgi:hypothetical protein